MDFRKCIVISAVIHAGLLAFAHTFEVPDVDDYMIFEGATRTVSMEAVEVPVHFERPAAPEEVAGSDEPIAEEELAGQESAEPESAEPEPTELAQAPEQEASEEPDPPDEPEPVEAPDDVDEPEIAHNDEPVVEDSPQTDADAAEELAEADTGRPGAEGAGDRDARRTAGPASADNTAGGSSSGTASHKTGQTGAPASGGGADIDRAQIARGYGHSVHKLLNRHKQYPRLAQRAGVQGTVTVRIVIDADGRILDVEIAQSSGHDVLDKAAVDSVRSLGKLPAPPDVLAWNRKPLQLPISYRLS